MGQGQHHDSWSNMTHVCSNTIYQSISKVDSNKFPVTFDFSAVSLYWVEFPVNKTNITPHSHLHLGWFELTRLLLNCYRLFRVLSVFKKIFSTVYIMNRKCHLLTLKDYCPDLICHYTNRLIFFHKHFLFLIVSCSDPEQSSCVLVWDHFITGPIQIPWPTTVDSKQKLDVFNFWSLIIKAMLTSNMAYKHFVTI